MNQYLNYSGELCSPSVINVFHTKAKASLVKNNSDTKDKN